MTQYDHVVLILQYPSGTLEARYSRCLPDLPLHFRFDYFQKQARETLGEEQPVLVAVIDDPMHEHPRVISQHGLHPTDLHMP